jgi:hypothetical protein
VWYVAAWTVRAYVRVSGTITTVDLRLLLPETSTHSRGRCNDPVLHIEARVVCFDYCVVRFVEYATNRNDLVGNEAAICSQCSLKLNGMQRIYYDTTHYCADYRYQCGEQEGWLVLRMKILVGTLEDYDALVRVAKVFELLADRVAELVGSANQIDGRV